MLIVVCAMHVTYCKGQSQKNTIEYVLKKQLKQGGAINFIQDYSESDFLASVLVIDSILKAHDYQQDSNFANKVRTIFGIEFIDRQYTSIKNSKGVPWSVSKSKPFSYDDEEYNYYTFVVFKGFITDFYLLPMLIDYTKVYPELARMEDTLNIITVTTKGQKVSLRRWKDNSVSLNQQREGYIKDIVAQNKYLFQGDQESWAYLKEKNHDFLYWLVEEIMFYGDNAINNFVMKSYSHHPNRMQNLFERTLFQKSKKGLRIGTELLPYIEQCDSKGQANYLDVLYEFAVNLYVSFSDKTVVSAYSPLDSSEPDKYCKLYNLSEKRKIIACITSVYNPLFNSLPQNSKLKLRYPNTPIDVIRYWDKGLLQEIEDNNYYGIENLKAIIDSIQTLNN